MHATLCSSKTAGKRDGVTHSSSLREPVYYTGIECVPCSKGVNEQGRRESRRTLDLTRGVDGHCSFFSPGTNDNCAEENIYMYAYSQTNLEQTCNISSFLNTRIVLVQSLPFPGLFFHFDYSFLSCMTSKVDAVVLAYEQDVRKRVKLS